VDFKKTINSTAIQRTIWFF